MIEGLWSLSFNAGAASWEGGILVFDGGRILGGNDSFTYVGAYQVEPAGTLKANIKVRKYLPPDKGDTSPFGPAMNDFALTVSAQSIDPGGTAAFGEVLGVAGTQIHLTFIKLEELPDGNQSRMLALPGFR